MFKASTSTGRGMRKQSLKIQNTIFQTSIALLQSHINALYAGNIRSKIGTASIFVRSVGGWTMALLFIGQSHAASVLPITEQNAQNLSLLGGSHLIYIAGNQPFGIADFINTALGNTFHQVFRCSTKSHCDPGENRRTRGILGSFGNKNKHLSCHRDFCRRVRSCWGRAGWKGILVRINNKTSYGALRI